MKRVFLALAVMGMVAIAANSAQAAHGGYGFGLNSSSHDSYRHASGHLPRMTNTHRHGHGHNHRDFNFRNVDRHDRFHVVPKHYDVHTTGRWNRY